MTNEQMSEHSAWRGLVAVLNDAGAVTPEDCRASTLDDSTPGRRVFQEIRVWADDQVIERCKAGRDGCRKPSPEPTPTFQPVVPQVGEAWDIGSYDPCLVRITEVGKNVRYTHLDEHDDGSGSPLAYGYSEFMGEQEPYPGRRPFRRVTP